MVYSYFIGSTAPTALQTMTFRLSAVLTATGQQLGNGEDTYSTRDEAQRRADFYNEQLADEPYRYVVTAA